MVYQKNIWYMLGLLVIAWAQAEDSAQGQDIHANEKVAHQQAGSWLDNGTVSAWVLNRVAFASAGLAALASAGFPLPLLQDYLPRLALMMASWGYLGMHYGPATFASYTWSQELAKWGIPCATLLAEIMKIHYNIVNENYNRWNKLNYDILFKDCLLRLLEVFIITSSWRGVGDDYSTLYDNSVTQAFSSLKEIPIADTALDAGSWLTNSTVDIVKGVGNLALGTLKLPYYLPYYLLYCPLYYLTSPLHPVYNNWFPTIFPSTQEITVINMTGLPLTMIAETLPDGTDGRVWHTTYQISKESDEQHFNLSDWYHTLRDQNAESLYYFEESLYRWFNKPEATSIRFVEDGAANCLDRGIQTSCDSSKVPTFYSGFGSVNAFKPVFVIRKINGELRVYHRYQIGNWLGSLAEQRLYPQ